MVLSINPALLVDGCSSLEGSKDCIFFKNNRVVNYWFLSAKRRLSFFAGDELLFGLNHLGGKEIDGDTHNEQDARFCFCSVGRLAGEEAQDFERE